jgi:hypothetical protein
VFSWLLLSDRRQRFEPDLCSTIAVRGTLRSAHAKARAARSSQHEHRALPDISRNRQKRQSAPFWGAHQQIYRFNEWKIASRGLLSDLSANITSNGRTSNETGRSAGQCLVGTKGPIRRRRLF